MSGSICFICVLVLQFALTAVAARIIIPILRSHKMGQKILDVGPRWHKSKEGTPTMGGLSFMAAALITTLTLGIAFMLTSKNVSSAKIIITVVFAFANGFIGIIDDRVKLLHKQNEGLTAGQKYALQLGTAVLYLAAMRIFGGLSTELYIPYADITVELGIFYYLFAVILITGIVNSVNLTDGVDGLASSVTAVVAVFYAAASFVLGYSESLFVSALTIGSCFGFLVYNFYPARVFMGDTGSLFLGGLTVGCAFLMNNPVIVLVAGLLYLIESLSVMIQVAYFKATHGKRFFRMAPIHHHFEKGGWSEIKVVAVFSLFTLITCVIAWFGLPHISF